MKRTLTKSASDIYHFVNGERISGATPGLSGNVSGLWGNVSGLSRETA